MSLDIHLLRFVLGEPADAACEPALTILKAACRDPDGAYFDNVDDVVLRDGSWIEMSAKGILSCDRFDGVGFFIRAGGCSPMAVTLMFDVAHASDMVIINTGGEHGDPTSPYVIITEERQRENLLPDWVSTAVLCESAQRLGEILGISFDKWHRWVCSDSTAST